MARSKKKAKEVKQPSPILAESTEEEEFQVEYIKAVKVSDEGIWWYGFDDPDQDTWEPEENLYGCQRLLKSLWKDIGTDNQDYHAGYEVPASPAWISLCLFSSSVCTPPHTHNDRRRIGKERARFLRDIVRKGKKIKADKKPVAGKAVTTARKSKTVEEEDDNIKEEDISTFIIPSPSTSRPSKKGKKGKKRKKPSEPEDEDESREKKKQRFSTDETTLLPVDSGEKAGLSSPSAAALLFSSEKEAEQASSSPIRIATENSALQSDPSPVPPHARSPSAAGASAEASAERASPHPAPAMSPSLPRLPPPPIQLQSKKKPTLPRLQTGSSTPIGSVSSPYPVALSTTAFSGPSSSLAKTSSNVGKSSTTPTLPHHKQTAIPVVTAGTRKGVSGLSTKQRLAQTAMQFTTPSQGWVGGGVSEASKPPPPQRTGTLSSNLSFKKTRGAPIEGVSPTIRDVDMLPRNLAAYSDYSPPLSSVQDNPLSASASTPVSAGFMSMSMISPPPPPSPAPTPTFTSTPISADISPTPVAAAGPASAGNGSNVARRSIADTPSLSRKPFPSQRDSGTSGSHHRHHTNIPPRGPRLPSGPAYLSSADTNKDVEMLPPPSTASNTTGFIRDSNTNLMAEADSFLDSMNLAAGSGSGSGSGPSSSRSHPPAPHLPPTVTSTRKHPTARRPNASKELAMWVGEVVLQSSIGTGEVRGGGLASSPHQRQKQTVCSQVLLMPSSSSSASSTSSGSSLLHLNGGTLPLKVAMSYTNTHTANSDSDSESRLALESFYSMNELSRVLLSCIPDRASGQEHERKQEWGWLGSERENEMTWLRKVAGFMDRKRLVSLVPIIIEKKRPAGFLLVYPSTMVHELVPTPLFEANDVALNVALYTWALPPAVLDRVRFLRDESKRGSAGGDVGVVASLRRRDPELPLGMYEPYGDGYGYGTEGGSVVEGAGRSLHNRAMIKHAVRIVEFPGWVYTFLLSLSPGSKRFGFWPPRPHATSVGSNRGKLPVPSHLSRLETEMEMLMSLLKECVPGAHDRGVVGKVFDPSLRVIFVHVSGMFGDPSGLEDGQSLSVRDLPNLTMYRSLNDVRFIVYGSSDYGHWSPKVEEIWDAGEFFLAIQDFNKQSQHPVVGSGGIVTFTPSALIDSPFEVLRRIRQIENHEIWVCYISPAAIGMAISLAYRNKEDVLRRRLVCTAFEHGRRRALSRNGDMEVDHDAGDDDVVIAQCTCDGGFEYEWLFNFIEEEAVSIVGAPPASLRCGSDNGAVLHKGLVRDAKPRRITEWTKFSQDLLAAHLQPSLDHPPIDDQFPPPPASSQYNHAFVDWTSEMFNNDFRSREETIEYCVQRFRNVCGDLPQQKWGEAVRKDIVMNMDRFQLVKGFREELRRFVVITGPEESDSDGAYIASKGGFEWVTAPVFRFNDETDNMVVDPVMEYSF
ncbi:hypothetical protein D9757_003996 [Collybiopsis confluens]|uniref:Chromo domain-containing protein n=1 Tax=Collybiopsis confluens TaxID=2823264 RepID=A0A8H5HWV8_9AGAR|nr:hypothetical protein D9757_003996 [Collybiopsis confluens]